MAVVLLTKKGMSPVVKKPNQNDRSIFEMLEEIERMKPDWVATVVEQHALGTPIFTSSREWRFSFLNATTP